METEDNILKAEESPKPRCPICGAVAECRRDLRSGFLLNSLSLYYGVRVPAKVHIGDFCLLACPKCKIEFSWPMNPGDASFYKWITQQESYYPKDRWEWGELRKWLAVQSRPLHLLEVGCGSGKFLESLKPLTHVCCVGLDPTEGAAASCRSKGIEVYAGTLEEYQNDKRHRLREFDVIVAFHCLEHVANPKGFVMLMRRKLAPGGRIFVSTPYSPMSFEGIWFDPLNHPPHHMTRWNQSSYTELARQLDLSPTLKMPAAARVSDRIAESWSLALNGPRHTQFKRAIMLMAIRQPLRLVKEVIRQVFREKVGGVTSANVVLVEFSPLRTAGNAATRNS